MRKIYDAPEVELIAFQAADVITLSNPGEDPEVQISYANLA